MLLRPRRQRLAVCRRLGGHLGRDIGGLCCFSLLRRIGDQRQTTQRANLVLASQHGQRGERRLDDILGIGGSEGLGQDVLNADALEHGSDRATGDDTGTFGGRLEQHSSGTEDTRDIVGNRSADHRNPNEVLLGDLDALANRHGHFLRLAAAETGAAVPVTDNHEGREREVLTTLDDLGHTGCDVDYPARRSLDRAARRGDHRRVSCCYSRSQPSPALV